MRWLHRLARAVRNLLRGSRAGASLERIRRDILHTLRSLRRAPGFAAVTILTLALGIGATTIIFSVADAALFKPLPYRDPDRLVEIVRMLGRGTAEQVGLVGLDWNGIDRWRAEPQIFEQVATFGRPRAVAPEPGGTGAPRVGRVSAGLLQMLGVRPLVGRWFTADECASDSRVVLLAEPFWRRAFGGRRDILGTTLTLDNQPYTIVGVMPPTFSFQVANSSTIGWIPFDEAAARRQHLSHGEVLKLRAGLSVPDARRLVHAVGERLQAGVAPNARTDFDLLPLDRRDLRIGPTTGTAVVVLLGAVTFVFLIASANVTALMLVRVLARHRELAVRAALGASRGRLAAQLVTESLVIAALAGVAAMVLASWGVQAVAALVPDQLNLFVANPAVIDIRSGAMCVGSVFAAGLLCGMVAAWRAGRADLATAFEAGNRQAGLSRRGRWLDGLLQLSQVAFTFVLLTDAGLLAASFVRMFTTPPGYNPEGLAYVSVNLPRARYPDRVTQDTFYDQLTARMRALPGVRGAALADLPSNPGLQRGITAFGHENDTERTGGLVTQYWIGPQALGVMGLPLRAGRAFGPEDTATSPPVALIDARTARFYWPGQSAIGQRFRTGRPITTGDIRSDAPWITVVGVVAPVRTGSFDSPDGTIEVYRPAAQITYARPSRTLLLRIDGSSTRPLALVQSVVHAMDPAVTPEGGLVEDTYADAFVTPRFYLALMSSLAGLALVVAAIGLYGVLSYAVGRQTREIGIRLALGASLGRIRRAVVLDALVPVAVGLAIGLAAALWLTRYLSSLLYDTAPDDPIALAAVVGLFLLVAGAAALVPAVRATRVDPVTALRVE
jgi:putative ABC transport system permease protein